MFIDKTNPLIPKTVRTLLGLEDNDQSILSDLTILNDVLVLEAQQILVDYAPSILTIETFTTEEQDRLNVAFIYALTSLFCGSMDNRLEIEVKTIDVMWRKKNIDYEKLESSLLQKAQNIVKQFNNYNFDNINSIFFRIAPSNRAVNSND